jgi:S-adenosylmethionine:tRNA ribosyltransferase-isomerase
MEDFLALGDWGGDFDYALPGGAIAQMPCEPRSAARLLVAPELLAAEPVVTGAGAPAGPDFTVAALPELLTAGDVLVVNETRVLPARLRLAKRTGGAAEVLLLEETATPGTWTALVRPGRRVPPGTELLAGDRPVVAVGADAGAGRRLVRLLVDDVETIGGEIPFPPYIHDATGIDPERYQTVYARRPGSVAAPTAGLHLTPAVLAACRARGVTVASVELAVGLDTFRPLTAPTLAEHVMHSERYRVPAETVAACEEARVAGGRVVAVGTTTVRALEAAAHTGVPEGRTDLFIRPGFEFRVVDVLLTNFHQPRSTLLVLLAAFYGPGWRELYRVALAEGYRFLSFGDAMLVPRLVPRAVAGQ